MSKLLDFSAKNLQPFVQKTNFDIENSVIQLLDSVVPDDNMKFDNMQEFDEALTAYEFFSFRI